MSDRDRKFTLNLISREVKEMRDATRLYQALYQGPGTIPSKVRGSKVR